MNSISEFVATSETEKNLTIDVGVCDGAGSPESTFETEQSMKERRERLAEEGTGAETGIGVRETNSEPVTDAESEIGFENGYTNSDMIFQAYFKS